MSREKSSSQTLFQAPPRLYPRRHLVNSKAIECSRLVFDEICHERSCLGCSGRQSASVRGCGCRGEVGLSVERLGEMDWAYSKRSLVLGTSPTTTLLRSKRSLKSALATSPPRRWACFAFLNHRCKVRSDLFVSTLKLKSMDLVWFQCLR